MNSRKPKTRKRVFIVLLVLFLAIFSFAIFKGGKYINVLFELLFKKEIQLKEAEESKFNVLIMGVGGGGHEGPDLTDTMIFASIDPENKKVTLVSIPRDLWIPELQAKINTAYTYGELKKEGGGLILAKSSVSKVLGQQIDYSIKVDFDGFVKAIDMVGGIDIDVENTLDDYKYPLEGNENELCGHEEESVASLSAEIATGSADELEVFPCRYEHLHFDKGIQRMNGTTALKFVRSRHGVNGEGSDFARSKRQEKVISAFRDKVFSVGTFLNPVKVVNLVDVFKDSIETDVKDDEYDDFVKLVQKMEGAKIESIVLDLGGGEERHGLLTENFEKQYYLSPRVGKSDFSEIHEFISCMTDSGSCSIGKNGIITPTPVIDKAN